MPINIDDPTNGQSVPSSFQVSISYMGVGDCKLSCTVAGTTQSTNVSDQGSWVTSPFTPPSGPQQINAETDTGDQSSVDVNVS